MVGRTAEPCGRDQWFRARNGSQRHRLHLGRGAGGVNLYLDNDAKFAFRPGVDEHNRYDRVGILDAPKEGTVVATVRDPRDVAAAVRVIEQRL